MKIYRIAVGDGEFRDLKDSVKNSKDDIRDLKGKIKDLESKLKSLQSDFDKINVGNRQFYQNTNIFTSLQRKLENLERIQNEWKNFKTDMDDKMKLQVEKAVKNI
jgi:predicted  nucleic acid-binding Zn-ribbon protein